MAHVDFTNFWTQDGKKFVREDQNVLTPDGMAHAAHADWLAENGFYRKIVSWYDEDKPEKDGWRVVDGVKYWAEAIKECNVI